MEEQRMYNGRVLPRDGKVKKVSGMMSMGSTTNFRGFHA